MYLVFITILCIICAIYGSVGISYYFKSKFYFNEAEKYYLEGQKYHREFIMFNMLLKEAMEKKEEMEKKGASDASLESVMSKENI